MDAPPDLSGGADAYTMTLKARAEERAASGSGGEAGETVFKRSVLSDSCGRTHQAFEPLAHVSSAHHECQGIRPSMEVGALLCLSVVDACSGG
jgi:hypothetical protein